MVYALACAFCLADVEHIDECSCEAAHLVCAVEACHRAQVDDVFLDVLCIVAVVACDYACIAIGCCAGDGAGVDDVAYAPCWCVACLSAYECCSIGSAFCCYVCFVDDVFEGDESLVAL